MSFYRFANLSIDMNCNYPTMQRRSRKYQVSESGVVDIRLSVTPEQMKRLLQEQPHLTPEEAEQILLGNQFSSRLLAYHGLVLHASAISYQGKGILFSANSGIGKSTHTRLWQTIYGSSQVPIINDDKPAIRYDQSCKEFMVYGTPFSGNSEENANLSCPLHAIVFLEQSPDNRIRPLAPSESLLRMLSQTLRPKQNVAYMEHLLGTLDEILTQIPVYLLQCNMECSAVELVVQTLGPF